MWKLFSMLFVIGATSVWAVDAAQACGGCGMSRGGGYGGGRATASRKAMGGGANLAQARPNSPRSTAPVATTRVGRGDHSTASRAKTVAVAAAKTSGKSARQKPIYTCPMHPQIQWTGAVDCPVCGMKLKPKAANADGNAPNDANLADASDAQGMGRMEDMMMCCPCCMGGK